MIARLTLGWNRFWFAPISARPLGAFRIAFGALALFNLWLLSIDFDFWLTNRGVLQGQEARQVAGPLRPSILFWLTDPTSARVVWAVAVAAAVGLTLGWRTRVMGVVFYLAMLSIHHRNVVTSSGADTLLMCFSFYLMLSPAGAAYSLDARREARRRGGTAAEPLIVPWAQRLLQVQTAGVYLVTGILKANGETWLDGTAMHYVICNREVGRWDFSALAAYPVLINIMTYAGLGIELCLAFLLWVKAARPWVIAAGLSLHFSILFFVDIPIFGELTAAGYLLFLTPPEFDWLRRRVDLIGPARRLLARSTARPDRWPIGRPAVASAEIVGPSA